MQAYQFYSKLKNDAFSLIYMGEFDDELTGLLMRIQETSTGEDRSMKKRMSYLIAECFQNIIRHSDEEKDHDIDLTSKMFMMRSQRGTHYLASSNPIEKSNIAKLSESLESLKNLSEEELRKIYLEALGNNVLSEKGGGGLGLIEMARKTKNPPKYAFESINEQFANFFFQLMLDTEGKEKDHLEINDTIELYEEMVNSNIVLLRKGDFSQESILPLFQLFESNLQLKKEDLVFKKKSLYILIELLQNMNRHAEVIDGNKEGLFTISFKNGIYIMETGNFVKKENAAKLKEHIDSLKGLDKKELAKRYKEQLLDDTVREDHGAGIGIIEMFRQSDGEIMYKFTDVNEHYSFFTLKATL
ncbi:MAG: hypothetical protein HUJ25_03450 [Crocinitomicaceae bacterium]|nr:hypothetical protein [Crocinitomicaceae bacterium]